MKKPVDDYFPESVTQIVDDIYCAGSDDQCSSLKNWLSKLRSLKRSILNLGEPTRKIWIMWLTKVMLRDKERLVYLVPHKVPDGVGGLAFRYNYLLIGKDGGSLHPDPIFVNTLDIRYLFKTDFDQRFDYIFEKLKLENRDFYYARLKDWVDTYRDGDINIAPTTAPDLIEVTRMLDHEKQQEYKSKKELKAEAKAVTTEEHKVKNILRVDPGLIKEMATIDQITDSGMWLPVKSYQTPLFDAGYWGEISNDQVSTLNILTNLILYPHSTKWMKFFVESYMRRMRQVANGFATRPGFFTELYTDEIAREVKNAHVQSADPMDVSNVLAKHLKKHLSMYPSIVKRSLVPIQIAWSEVVPNDDGGLMLVDFVANDYTSYARLSLAFGAGKGKITSQKSLYIRNAFSIPTNKLAHVVIMNLFPSTTAMTDQAFLAMCNFGDKTVIGKVLTTEGVADMVSVKDLDILRVQFTDIPGRAMAFTRDTLINKFVEWRDLVLAIAPTHDDKVTEQNYVPIKDMLKILLDDLFHGASVQSANQKTKKPSQPKEPKKKATPPKTPELARTVEETIPEPEQPKKFGLSLAEQLSGIRVEKSPSLESEDKHTTTVIKETPPEPEPTPTSPVKEAIQEKKKAEQKAKREEKKVETSGTPLEAIDMSTWPEAEQKVARVIYKLKNARRMEIQEKLKLHPKVIMHACQALAKRGVIRMEGVTRAARWIWVGGNDKPESKPVLEVKPVAPEKPLSQEKPATSKIHETSTAQENGFKKIVTDSMLTPANAVGIYETEVVQRLKSFVIPLGEDLNDEVPTHLYLLGRTCDLKGERYTITHFSVSRYGVQEGSEFAGLSYDRAREMWTMDKAHWQDEFPKEVIDAINTYFCQRS